MARLHHALTGGATLAAIAGLAAVSSGCDAAWRRSESVTVPAVT